LFLFGFWIIKVSLASITPIYATIDVNSACVSCQESAFKKPISPNGGVKRFAILNEILSNEETLKNVADEWKLKSFRSG
jgi:hypothetical protein